MRIAVAFVAAVALLGADLVQGAETLAEAAARERERRKGKTGKVMTEVDLGRAGGGTLSTTDEPASTTTTTTTTGGAPSAEGGEGKDKKEKEKTDEELRTDAETDWRKRMTAAQAERTAAPAEGKRPGGARGADLNRSN